MGDAKAEGERHNQSSHNVERSRDAHGEERLYALRLANLRQLQVVGYERREHRLPHSIRKEAGEDGGAVRHECGYYKQFAGSLADVGDCRRDESDDDKRNKETEELAEERVERYEHAHGHVGRHDAESDTEDNGNDNLREQAQLDSFHTWIVLSLIRFGAKLHIIS